MHSKTAKMALFGRHDGGKKKGAKKEVSRYTRRVEAKQAVHNED